MSGNPDSTRDFGKTDDYALVNSRGDQFPVERGVTLRAMRIKALSMKFRVNAEYTVIEARTTRKVFDTRGEDPLADPDVESEIIGPASRKGKEILRQAKSIFEKPIFEKHRKE